MMFNWYIQATRRAGRRRGPRRRKRRGCCMRKKPCLYYRTCVLFVKGRAGFCVGDFFEEHLNTTPAAQPLTPRFRGAPRGQAGTKDSKEKKSRHGTIEGTNGAWRG